MALLWAESFDLYGSSIAALLLRGYNYSFTNGLNTPARTGPRCLGCSAGTTNAGLGRSLDTPVNVIGIGVAQKMTTTAATNANSSGINIGTSAGWSAIKALANGDLGYSIYQGSTLLGSTPNNIYAVGAYNYLELKVRNNAATGGLGDAELRVNGVTQLIVTGINLTLQFTRFGLGIVSAPGNGTGTSEFDDLVVWDNSGSFNNDFMGDRRCETMFPDANGALQQWVASAGNAWDCINEATPSDVDYIQANTNGDISTFTKTAIGISTNDIAALVHVARALKTDAGASSIKLGIDSGAFTDNGPDIALTTSAAYYQHIVQRDPNGSVAWTKAAADAALMRFTRSL